MGQIFKSNTSKPLRLRCRRVDRQEITYISWDDLMVNVDKIIYLDCSDNNLTTLPESIGNLTQLQRFYCCSTQLTALPESIGNLTQLQTFYCSSNRLTALPESIWNLTQLKEFCCSSNRLTALPESISNLTQLEEFNCEYNRLTTLPESIGNLTQIQKFCCSSNHLTALPESIGNIAQLQLFDCGDNQLTALPESIGNLTQLKEFCCSSNQLRTLPIQFIECQRLEYLNIQGNPIEMIPAPLQRIINRMRQHQMRDGIYRDKQNVHSSAIQASVKQSIYNLLNDTSLQEFSNNQLRELIVRLPPDLLSDKTKSALFEYMASSEEHSTLAITFCDLLKKVIGRVEKCENKGEIRKDLYQRLNEEMADAECKCFTGRLSRLVNVLVGFFDDIRIEISGAEQISVVIALVKTRHQIGDEDEVTPEAKAEIRTELEARGYEPGVIEEWLAALD